MAEDRNGTANGAAPAVEARGLGVSIDAHRLLDRIDLRAAPGQFIGLIGPNGAGKSTLLRALARVLNYQEGSVDLLGADLQSRRPRQTAALLALVPQLTPDTHGFTALELVLMGRYPHLGRLQVEGASDRDIALAAMQQTETAHFQQRTLETLSGGERQRVFLARALAQQPQVLLLDEPTASLDLLHQLQLLALVRKLVDDGLTAIAAIHDLNLAARYCDRLALLSGGTLLTEGTPAEVLTPETIAAAFSVRAHIARNPATGSLSITPLEPADPAERGAEPATLNPPGP